MGYNCSEKLRLLITLGGKRAVSREIIVLFENEEQLKKEVYAEIKDVLYDEFSDEIYEALEQYRPEPKGSFDLSLEGDKVYSGALNYINRVFAHEKINVEMCDENGNVIDKYQVDFLEHLSSLLIERQEDEAWDCDIGDAVEYALSRFENEGIWQHGLKSAEGILLKPSEWPDVKMGENGPVWEMNEKVFEPIIWFGAEGVSPQKPWTIEANMEADEINFWFTTDENDIMEMLVGDEGCFLVWYIYECGRRVPDITAIKDKCPISFDENSTADEISLKMYEFFKEIKESGR